MDKKEIIEKLNKSFRGDSLNGNEYLPLLSEFLGCEYPAKASVIIQLVMGNPLLIGQTVEKVRDYFIKKYNLFYLSKNNQIILFYES